MSKKEEEKNIAYGAASSPAGMVALLRSCLITPFDSNISAIFHPEKGLDDFGEFLKEISYPLAHMYFRQGGNFIGIRGERLDDLVEQAVVGSPTIRGIFAGAAPCGVLDRFRVTSGGLVGLNVRVSSRRFIKVLNQFMIQHFNSADPVFLAPIAKAWKNLLGKNPSYGFDRSGKPIAIAMLAMAGLSVDDWPKYYPVASSGDIENVFNIQEEFYRKNSSSNLDFALIRAQNSNIINLLMENYGDCLVPEIAYAHLWAQEVNDILRREFHTSLRASYLKDTARELRKVQDTLPDYAQIPDPVLRAMESYGTFGSTQLPGQVGSLTVQHTVPLANFPANLSIMPGYLNWLLDKLFHNQTALPKLPKDEVLRGGIKGMKDDFYHIKEAAPSLPVVVLRQRLIEGTSVRMSIARLFPDLFNAPFLSSREMEEINRGFIPGYVRQRDARNIRRPVLGLTL